MMLETPGQSRLQRVAPAPMVWTRILYENVNRLVQPNL